MSDFKVVSSSRFVKGSVQKVALVASLVRGLSVKDALLQLRFCKKKASKDVAVVLFSAIANAENNFNIDSDTLFVNEINVGKSIVIKRVMPRARGSAAPYKRCFSSVRVILSQNKKSS